MLNKITLCFQFSCLKLYSSLLLECGALFLVSEHALCNMPAKQFYQGGKYGGISRASNIGFSKPCLRACYFSLTDRMRAKESLVRIQLIVLPKSSSLFSANKAARAVTKFCDSLPMPPFVVKIGTF